MAIALVLATEGDVFILVAYLCRLVIVVIEGEIPSISLAEWIYYLQSASVDVLYVAIFGLGLVWSVCATA